MLIKDSAALERPQRGRHRPLTARRQTDGRFAGCTRTCTVTFAHSKTRDLPALAATAISWSSRRTARCAGSWIKPGAIVIDVGMNRLTLPLASRS